MTFSTGFVLPSASFLVTHEPTTGDPGRISAGLLLTEDGATPNTLTTISARIATRTETIFLLWEPPSWHLQIHLLFVQETSVLFVGGGTFSACIDINPLRLIHQHQVDMFWTFQHARNSIVELGELECSLYRTNGMLMGSVPVDPPYDIVEHETHIEFISSIFGSQCLMYPVA